MSQQLDRARRYHEAIRHVLLRDWDPIGIADEPGAQDEYDSYVHEIHGMLIRHEPRHRLVDHLWWIETQHMGLLGRRPHTEAVADRLLGWRDEIEADGFGASAQERGTKTVMTVGLYYDVIPEKAPLFLAKFREVIGLMEGMAGHRATHLYQRVDDPHSYAILSEWDDRQAFGAFVRSETFRQVTTWGREEVLRNAPRHHVYTKGEEMGGPPGR